MVAVPATPPFVVRVERVSAEDLPYSWRPGCPVAPSQLRRVRLAYWGFDGRRHLGALVVNERVTADVASVFRTLYRARFPIRRMRPIDAYRGDDDRSAAADNTSAFNCRRAVTNGPASWSMHAYGEAVDLDPRENPYVGCGMTRDKTALSYLNRSRHRPGMVTPAVRRAFASIGWGWGGSWFGSTKDYMHFSINGH